MRVFVINDKVVINIINNLTISEEVKNIIKDIIIRYDYTYINFIYSIFSVYTTYYLSIMNENSNLNIHDAQSIYNQFRLSNVEADMANIFIADVYDIIYSTSDINSKFKCFFYEDIFSRLSNIIGENNANLHMEEIFEILEYVFGSIEETIIFGLIKEQDITSNIIIYTEINGNCLMIYIL